MDAIEALHKRVSVPRLGGAAPDAKTREAIYKAALRAPDHAQLKPWRYLEIEGEGREALGELFAKALKASNPDIPEKKLVKARSKPLRAPLILVLIVSPVPHRKVPEVEQMLSVGAAAQNILVACHALGVGAMWRTGSMAYEPIVQDGLGLERQEEIMGFLYLGEPQGKVRAAPELDPSEFFAPWPDASWKAQE